MGFDFYEIKLLVERSPLFAKKHVHVVVIANPVAGGFTMKKKARDNEAWLKSAQAASAQRPIVTASVSFVLHLTADEDHARKLARTVLEQALGDSDSASVYLLITAGGDGTSLDVQTELAKSVLEEGHTELADRVCLLRLPFGTGNDGSDGRTLDASLSLLSGNGKFAKQSAVRVRTSCSTAKTWYAFNIASIGVDAFITHMTNRIKNRMPGDFYKIWVDLACLFYNKIYHVGTMSVTARDRNGRIVMQQSDRMILYLMGASGFRTYGSNQNILPSVQNVCGIREMPLFRKLKLKEHFKAGTHTKFPETIMYSAQSIEIGYEEKILVQMDGEAHLLLPQDFPLVMELTEPFVTILTPIR